MDDATIEYLIERAISWEIAARDLYVTLSEAFPSQPSVAETWRQMAIDESAHAAILRDTRASLPESRLAEHLGTAETALIESVEGQLAQVRAAKLRTLDDAYELAHGLESSEVNTVFQLVVSFHAEDVGTEALIDAQLEEHIGRLTRLADQFDRAARRSMVLQK